MTPELTPLERVLDEKRKEILAEIRAQYRSNAKRLRQLKWRLFALKAARYARRARLKVWIAWLTFSLVCVGVVLGLIEVSYRVPATALRFLKVFAFFLLLWWFAPSVAFFLGAGTPW